MLVAYLILEIKLKRIDMRNFMEIADSFLDCNGYFINTCRQNSFKNLLILSNGSTTEVVKHF
jgi:hypothetical protein